MFFPQLSLPVAFTAFTDNWFWYCSSFMWTLNSKLRHLLKFCLSCFDFPASSLLCLHLLCRRYFYKTGELSVLKTEIFFPQQTIEISFCSMFCPCNNCSRRQKHCTSYFCSLAVMPLLRGMLWKAYHILIQCLDLHSHSRETDIHCKCKLWSGV